MKYDVIERSGMVKSRSKGFASYSAIVAVNQDTGFGVLVCQIGRLRNKMVLLNPDQAKKPMADRRGCTESEMTILKSFCGFPAKFYSQYFSDLKVSISTHSGIPLDRVMTFEAVKCLPADKVGGMVSQLTSIKSRDYVKELMDHRDRHKIEERNTHYTDRTDVGIF